MTVAFLRRVQIYLLYLLTAPHSRVVTTAHNPNNLNTAAANTADNDAVIVLVLSARSRQQQPTSSTRYCHPSHSLTSLQSLHSASAASAESSLYVCPSSSSSCCCCGSGSGSSNHICEASEVLEKESVRWCDRC